MDREEAGNEDSRPRRFEGKIGGLEDWAARLVWRIWEEMEVGVVDEKMELEEFLGLRAHFPLGRANHWLKYNFD